MILGSDTVTILRGRTRNTSGDLAGTDSSTEVAGCSVQPLGGAEQTDRGEAVQVNLTVYLPPGTDIVATDRVRWGGDVYAVNGPPSVWRDETGTEDHVQVQLLLRKGQS